MAGSGDGNHSESIRPGRLAAMETESEDLKSCSVQPLTELPSRSWGLERLTEFACEQHAQLVAGERQTAPVYWRLGMALYLIRENFTHGQWTTYLESHEIEKTRAARARAIFRTFSSENGVQGLTVQEAYDQRARCEKATSGVRPSSPRSQSTELRRKMASFRKDVTGISELVATAPFDQRQQLRRRVVLLIKQLQSLERLLTSEEAPTSCCP